MNYVKIKHIVMWHSGTVTSGTVARANIELSKYKL